MCCLLMNWYHSVLTFASTTAQACAAPLGLLLFVVLPQGCLAQERLVFEPKVHSRHSKKQLEPNTTHAPIVEA